MPTNTQGVGTAGVPQPPRPKAPSPAQAGRVPSLSPPPCGCTSNPLGSLRRHGRINWLPLERLSWLFKGREFPREPLKVYRTETRAPAPVHRRGTVSEPRSVSRPDAPPTRHHQDPSNVLATIFALKQPSRTRTPTLPGREGALVASEFTTDIPVIMTSHTLGTFSQGGRNVSASREE